MVSTVAWLDYDSEAHQRAQRILTLFNERETRDELGLGTIRDAIADTLFPGTSTIQTRLRYMLFLPWIFLDLERRGTSAEKMARRARAAQLKLAEYLGENCPGETGNIGGEAGKGLKRLPSDVYWTGLGTWGIRLFPGTEGQYRRALDHIYRRRKLNSLRRSKAAEEGDDVGGLWEQAATTWHPGIPEPPDDFPEGADFRLRREEAHYLQERVRHACPDSLLTDLLAEPMTVQITEPWDHPGIADFRADHRPLLDHAHNFALVAQGAALLYNILLAELRGSEELAEKHRASGSHWGDRVDARLDELIGWADRLDKFWLQVTDRGHAIGPRTVSFVTEWVAELVRHRRAVFDDPRARRLVRDREIEKKRANSRFTNKRVLDQWGGSSGLQLFTYRWDVVQGYIEDTARALGR